MRLVALLVFYLISAVVDAAVVEGPPLSVPQNVTLPGSLVCRAISSTEIRVSWQSPPTDSIHGILRGYTVDYATANQSYNADEWDRDVQHKTTSVNETILNGLKKNTSYAIKVCATTSVGCGAHSEAIFCSTEEDVPDEPVDVKVVVYGTEKVLVLWHAPISQESGKILYYTIHYQKKGSEKKMGNVLAHIKSYEIFGLEPNKPYEFWVTASSKVGEGPASEYVTATPSEETPAKIPSLNERVTAPFKISLILLRCQPVGTPKPNVIWQVNGKKIIETGRFEIYSSGLFINDVIREDANNYTCIAENEFGSDSITYELIVKAPPKSPEVTILSTTTDEITLQLKPNRTDSAANHGFTLFYKLDSEIEDWQQVKVSSQPYKIEHCKCGSTYRIYAHGFNDVGNGEASETLAVRTNGSIPIAPTKSDFIEPSAEGITLHVSSWSADSCPITHFFVEFKKRLGTNVHWTRIRNKLRPNTDFVLNLEAATFYDIRVTAHNAAGSTRADYEVETST